jgi:hypothetical protein
MWIASVKGSYYSSCYRGFLVREIRLWCPLDHVNVSHDVCIFDRLWLAFMFYILFIEERSSGSMNPILLCHTCNIAYFSPLVSLLIHILLFYFVKCKEETHETQMVSSIIYKWHGYLEKVSVIPISYVVWHSICFYIEKRYNSIALYFGVNNRVYALTFFLLVLQSDIWWTKC